MVIAKGWGGRPRPPPVATERGTMVPGGPGCALLRVRCRRHWIEGELVAPPSTLPMKSSPSRKIGKRKCRRGRVLESHIRGRRKSHPPGMKHVARKKEKNRNPSKFLEKESLKGRASKEKTQRALKKKREVIKRKASNFSQAGNL